MLRQRFKKKMRKNKFSGGAVSMEFDVPEVNATTPSQALQGVQSEQKINAEQVVSMNKAMAGGGGGGIVVPQMGPAGQEGNNSIANSISSTLQGRSDGEFDKQVDTSPPKTLGGGRKSRRHKKKKSHKTKKKSRKFKKHKSKSKKKRKRKYGGRKRFKYNKRKTKKNKKRKR